MPQEVEAEGVPTPRDAFKRSERYCRRRPCPRPVGHACFATISKGGQAALKRWRRRGRCHRRSVYNSQCHPGRRRRPCRGRADGGVLFQRVQNSRFVTALRVELIGFPRLCPGSPLLRTHCTEALALHPGGRWGDSGPTRFRAVPSRASAYGTDVTCRGAT